MSTKSIISKLGIGVLGLGIAFGLFSVLTQGSAPQAERSESGVAAPAVATKAAPAQKKLDRSASTSGSAPAPAAFDREQHLKAQMNEFETWKDDEIAAGVVEVDERIETGRWIERANSDELSADEREELENLLSRRDALNLVRAERLLAALDTKEIQDFDTK
jgi:hypothetical protein